MRRTLSTISIVLCLILARATFGVQQETPTPTPPPCDDVWTAISTDALRSNHTAVWTGTHMIVWGGSGDVNFSNTGGRYDPVTDTWTPTSTTNAPAGRAVHTAVWTGTEMIVWGGEGANSDGHFLNTGGRYNPATDTWTAVSTTNAPEPRYYHTAVWTGTEMIVWGGYDGLTGSFLNTGGRYNPATDTWTPLSTTNAPAARYYHTAVWTGTEMIVWGGLNSSSLNTGGRYDPATDTWTPVSTTNAPARYVHKAVWTGSEMIVWGGTDGGNLDLNTGGRYDPDTDTWSATSTANAPSERHYHTAIWTGTEMMVWGGYNGGFFNTGGRYTPATDSWTVITTTDAPTGRALHTAVWSGTEMIVWGGGMFTAVNTGGRYCGQSSSPSPTPTSTPTPTPKPTPTPTPKPTPTATATATPTPTATPTASPTPTATPTGTPAEVELLNISGRVIVQTGDKVGIAGFTVNGSGFKRFIARAIGPSMQVNGVPVPGRLMDPVLELHDSNGATITNDNWRSGGQEAEIQSSGLAPSDNREAAIIRTVPAGGFTAIIRGANDTTGIGLIEIYDLGTTTSAGAPEATIELGNLSVRGDVQTGDNVLVDGLILAGGKPKRVLFRALGPSMQSNGKPVPGTLQDPTLDVYDANGTVLRANDDWQQAPNAAEIQATGIAPPDNKESAVLLGLTAGAYTSIVRGANNTTGIALAETYKLDN